MGDRSFEVIHVSGHTAGSIALWDAAAGLVFTGDTAALDDPLHAEDEEVFMASLIRLRSCRWSSSAPAQSRPFGRDELRALIDEQLVARG